MDVVMIPARELRRALHEGTVYTVTPFAGGYSLGSYHEHTSRQEIDMGLQAEIDAEEDMGEY